MKDQTKPSHWSSGLGAGHGAAKIPSPPPLKTNIVTTITKSPIVDLSQISGRVGSHLLKVYTRNWWKNVGVALCLTGDEED